MFKLHILPILGNYKVKNLDTATAQNGVNKWSSFVSSNKMIGYARSVMSYALKEEYAVRNPFDLIIKPKVEPPKKEKYFYETAELKQLMAVIDDWDEENKTLRIDKALGVKEREGKTEVYLKGPKIKLLIELLQ